MKSVLSFFVIWLLLNCPGGIAQTITLTFSGQYNGNAVPLDSIRILNLDKDCDTTLFYPDSILVLQVLGIDRLGGYPAGLFVFPGSPNPVMENTLIKIYTPVTQDISVVVTGSSGKQVCSHYERLEQGYHIFEFSPGHGGNFIFSVSTSGSAQSIKVISGLQNAYGISGLHYAGRVGGENMLKSALTGRFVFSAGDSLRYTGYYQSGIKVLGDAPQHNKSYNFHFSGAVFTCGQPLMIHHQTSGGVAPVDKITSYGTVNNIPGEVSKCWLTSNLGSDRQATSVDDPTETSAGWFWQFNRKQGYKHDGIAINPAWTIASIDEDSDWLITNDPCSLELGSPWRLPVYTEWSNVHDIGLWTNRTGPWDSELKLHATGYLVYSNGSLNHPGTYGNYWSSTQEPSRDGWYLHFSETACSMYFVTKAYGFPIRCLRDM